MKSTVSGPDGQRHRLRHLRLRGQNTQHGFHGITQAGASSQAAQGSGSC